MSAGDHFVCVQSVVADANGNLWVVDPAAPATAFIVPGGPKLVRIDLKTNKVAQVIRLRRDGRTSGQLSERCAVSRRMGGMPI